MEHGNKFSAEIQGLRAVAVLSVLFFHIWPSKIPGGYVGVDVFFVISGYLITGALIRELDSRGTISISGFYQRRIKRLMPAATVTIIGAALAYRLQPVVTWAATSKSIVASTLYSQNWWLAHESADYWAQDDSPGTLQHFWSLAVEEQFYIVWPLLIILAAWAARKASRAPLTFIRGTMVVLLLISLVHCITLSQTDPSLAYFSTTTRAWELALGGALALWPHARSWSPKASQWLAAVGLAMILVACFVFDDQTTFPGYAALLPTVGATMIIAAGTSPSPLSISRLLRTKWSQFYGDISYSLYLWHWPVLILYQQLTDSRMNMADGMIVFVVSAALAHHSKLLVEDPIRARGVFDKRRWHTFAFALGCMALALATAWWIDRAHSKKQKKAHRPTLAQKYYDAVHTLSPDDRAIAALAAKDDIAPWYRSKCRGYQRTVEPVPCDHGPLDATVNVTLIGDSHAVHWEPAFIELAKDKSWGFQMYAKTMCSMGDHSVSIGKESVVYETCDTYRDNLMKVLLREKPDIVIISQSSAHKPIGVDEDRRAEVVAQSLERTVRTLQRAGIEVLLMADTPWLKESGPECLSAPKYTPGSCDVSVERFRKRRDPVLILSDTHPDIGALKMSQHLCDDKTCKVIIDGMIVYKDAHHLTARFAKSLAKKLGAELAPFLE